MQEPNRLMIGSELTERAALEQIPLVKPKKKLRILPLMSFLCFSLLLSGMAWMQSTTGQALNERELQMETLIDEIGALNEQNYVLSEHVNSQDAVLQSMAMGFAELEKALNTSETGEYGFLESMLADISNDLAKEGAYNEKVQVASVTEDKTYDILILGTNGAHTDTIMIASINEAKKKVTLFSIPRDLYVNGRRINSYYTYYGIDQMQRMVESVVGLKIDHYVQIDLNGFVEVVDSLGGVDIYVDKAIYDGTYPGPNGTYQPYSIEVGHHHMDGTEALKYARTRHADSDFGRAARQQKVLSALRTKMEQLDGIMDMKQLAELLQLGLNNTTTDISLLDLVGFYYDYRDFDLSTGFVLTSSNYLYSRINESGAYTLLPKDGNFNEIQKVISDLVN